MYKVEFLIFILGLVFGSFISAYTYRLPKNISISKGRSFCPKCKSKIAWYDNIPILSYVLLSGKCRRCGLPISLRYPVIEISTGAAFLTLYLFLLESPQVFNNYLFGDINFININKQIFLTLPYLLTITGILIAIFVMDFEYRIIPDNLIYTLFIFQSVILIVFNSSNLYTGFLAGLSASLFLLILHLVTKGKGMGLGDVKLVIPLGMLLGLKNVYLWMLTSFVIGALVGLILIFLKKTSFGRQIAFGPFLIISFYINLFFGSVLMRIFSINLL